MVGDGCSLPVPFGKRFGDCFTKTLRAKQGDQRMHRMDSEQGRNILQCRWAEEEDAAQRPLSEDGKHRGVVVDETVVERENCRRFRWRIPRQCRCELLMGKHAVPLLEPIQLLAKI